MHDTPTARQRQILELLSARRMLTTQELARELGVSSMTVHRDLDKLADAGHLAKTHGGASLPSRIPNSVTPDLCAMCHRIVPQRTTVIIQDPQRGRLSACCPHCGLALIDLHHATDLMLVTDFLYCRMINAGEAIYLIGSEVSLCCTPGILAFASVDDAARFQRGFGGETMELMQAHSYLRNRMLVSA